MMAAPRSAAASKNGNSSGVEVPVVAVRADLHALQAQLVDAAFQLAYRQVGRLQRHGADTGVVARMIVADARHLVVQVAMQLQRLVTRRPVREQHRHRGHHLHADVEAGVIVDALLRIEGGVPYLPEELAILIDAMASIVMDHHRKPVVAVLGGKVRPVAGEDVGVRVDFEHAPECMPRPGCRLGAVQRKPGRTTGFRSVAARFGCASRTAASMAGG